MSRRYSFAWPRAASFALKGAAFVIALAALFAKPAITQTVWPLFPVRAASIDERCANRFSVGLVGGERAASPLRQSADLAFDDACEAPGRGGWRWLSESTAAPRVSPPTDVVEDELAAMGPEGALIAAARQEVLEILREGNVCSAWYARAEPDPAIKFATLRFHVDAQGEASAFTDFDVSSRLYYREPYVASAQQDVGPGSIITLNAHGAFFRSQAPMEFRAPVNLLHFRSNPGFLRVGPYSGGTLKARVATLFHEYAHVVGLLPVDSGLPSSALLSTQNTDVVLSHCHRQIEASPNRAIVLPARLAGNTGHPPKNP